MPAPALQSLAKKYGKSLKDAERYYKEAKKQREKKVGKDLDSADYSRIMGVVKIRLSLPVKKVESYDHDILLAIHGVPVNTLVESYLEADRQVRTFFDSGMLSFASLDDVMIEANEDNRISIMSSITNDNTWPHDHLIHELFDGYEVFF